MMPVALQVTLAAVLPGSAGESGSAAWKLMVPGVAVMLLTEITSFGWMVRGLGANRAGGPAAARKTSSVEAQAGMAPYVAEMVKVAVAV
jgi:hypothetical protein